jgi:hypothetical protein
MTRRARSARRKGVRSSNRLPSIPGLLILLLITLPGLAQVTRRTSRPAARPLASAVLTPLIAQDPASSASTSVATTTLSWSHTVGASPDRLLLVGVSISAGTAVSSVTWGAQPLSLVGAQNGQSTQSRMELWSLVAPATGTATVTVTMSAAVVFGAGARSFSDVDQTTPLGAFVGAGDNTTTPTATAASGAGELVFDTVAARGDAATLTADASQTPVWNFTTGSSPNDVIGAGSTKPGASTVTMAWTEGSGSGKSWAMGAVSIRPATTVPTPTFTFTSTPTPTWTPTPTSTPTSTPTNTSTPTSTPTWTSTPTPTFTSTPTSTPTPPPTPTPALPDAAALTVDAHGTGTTSNLNGVLESGETVVVEPAWHNATNQTLTFTGAASNIGGPPGPTYGISDSTGDYGSAVSGATTDCYNATPSHDSYQMTVSGARPVPHWDAQFDETLSLGNGKTWLLHVGGSFTDVPVSHEFYRWIENLYHNGITGGCGAGIYCPSSSVTRGQAAVFLLRSKHGADYVPPPCTGIFTDLACPAGQFVDWVEELFIEGITVGCGPSIYCPTDPVTRGQMAALLLKAKYGAGYLPPPCAGVFSDVVCPSLFSDWIEQLYAEHITSGCGPSVYCPNDPNTRGQMAVFLVRTFGLLLYGP